MLVLSRKQEEQIRISDDIVVTVLRIKGNTVKIGIDAPRSMRVVRSELPPQDETAPEARTEVATAEEPSARAIGAVAKVVPALSRAVRGTRRGNKAAPLSRFEAVIAQAIAK